MPKLMRLCPNRSQVEAEYQDVLRTREEIREYWEECNRERFAELARKPHKPDQEALWTKLEQQIVDRANPGDEAATHELLAIPKLLERIKQNQVTPKSEYSSWRSLRSDV
jgi:hypothetical protein